MSPEEQRIAIAEACGWKHRLATDDNPVIRHGMRLPRTFGEPIEAFWHDDIKGVYGGPPDYLNDLNAMHEAESSLTVEAQNDYYGCLLDIARKSQRWNHIEYETIHATSAQRAEAFLRTIGKWKD